MFISLFIDTIVLHICEERALVDGIQLITVLATFRLFVIEN